MHCQKCSKVIVTIQYLLGAGLLATVGAVGAIGTLILAEKVDDFETRIMVLQTEINNLIDQIKSLEDNNETDDNPNSRSLDLTFFKIKDVEHDIKDCQDAVSSLCNFVSFHICIKTQYILINFTEYLEK